MADLIFATYGLLVLLQVTAGTTPGGAGRTEVPDPMQIDVSLGADVDIKGNPRLSFDQQPLGKARAYPETDRFVCDQARVLMLTVKKVAETETEVVIEAAPTLISEWPLQDVDLTVALVGKDGQVVGRRSWDNLTREFRRSSGKQRHLALKRVREKPRQPASPPVLYKSRASRISSLSVES